MLSCCWVLHLLLLAQAHLRWVVQLELLLQQLRLEPGTPAQRAFCVFVCDTGSGRSVTESELQVGRPWPKHIHAALQAAPAQTRINTCLPFTTSLQTTHYTHNNNNAPAGLQPLPPPPSHAAVELPAAAPPPADPWRHRQMHMTDPAQTPAQPFKWFFEEGVCVVKRTAALKHG